MDFPRLSAELDNWARAGRCAPFWWRDDDAVEPSSLLERLLALAHETDAPLALAVIPGPAQAALAGALAAAAQVGVLVHGFHHANHAPPGAKKCEFGPARPLSVLEADAKMALAALAALLPQTLPVFVPPWNRIAPALVPRLAGLGYRGISTAGPRPAPAVAGLAVANTHLDPIAWRAGRGLTDTQALETLAVSHLRAARQSRPGGEEPEPLGLLTHHLVHGKAVWGFVGRFARLIADHPGSCWVSPHGLFAPPGAARAVAIEGQNG